MGLGIYLIYPAFYTDVTDSYRLGRWARVRTDLGGFSFYLIWALGMIALYLTTGQEFLLFVVLLINLDIVRQMLPFFRLDGYWALADLTGVPDFFSQAGPFLRSVLPVPGKGDRLPGLKRWVKTVFAFYIFLTVPVLLLLMFLFVTRLPTFTGIMWDALHAQLRELEHAWSDGSSLRLLAAVSQILLLALEMLGVAFLLYKLTWSLLKGLWKWSQPTPARRISGALIAAAAVTAIGFSWVPRLSSLNRTVPIGVQTFEVPGRTHVDSPVSYPQVPPVGGDHAPIWQNCGFYATPIANENGVHSLEHGAVWITYRPGLATEQVAALRELPQRQSHVLVSPFEDLPSPVVASAWGRQLRLDSAEDPRLEQFVRAFRLAEQAPENGGPCTGGIGKSG